MGSGHGLSGAGEEVGGLLLRGAGWGWCGPVGSGISRVGPVGGDCERLSGGGVPGEGAGPDLGELAGGVGFPAMCAAAGVPGVTNASTAPDGSVPPRDTGASLPAAHAPASAPVPVSGRPSPAGAGLLVSRSEGGVRGDGVRGGWINGGNIGGREQGFRPGRGGVDRHPGPPPVTSKNGSSIRFLQTPSCSAPLTIPRTNFLTCGRRSRSLLTCGKPAWIWRVSTRW